MATTAKHAKGMASERYAELKRMLEDRKREIMSEVHEKIRDVRTESGKGKMSEVFDPGESSEADIQEDIEFALIQMKAETLRRSTRRWFASKKGLTATASSAARTSPSSGCGRCPSPSAARTASRRARTPPSASASCPSGRGRPSSLTSRADCGILPAGRRRRGRGPRPGFRLPTAQVRPSASRASRKEGRG